MIELRFDVFGRRIAVVGAPGAWRAYLLGGEGKRRPADFVVPGSLAADEIAQYLADLFHEAASPEHPTVERLP